ncbi:hypothetical protein WAB97_001495 [Stenotrophomonas maltophilia]|uniref:hypothetical protein n=1 Tax=Stenotrophomonas maltophilia group TaxID=995085 RepID=UPI000A5426BA|nr:hypothetical protein [Stenotrophomonas maltophilia]VEE52039.1 Uncharacterised protein [Stenotrophomonas maltophilia]
MPPLQCPGSRHKECPALLWIGGRRAPEPAQRLARWLPIVAWCLLGVGVAIIPVFLPGLSPA